MWRKKIRFARSIRRKFEPGFSDVLKSFLCLCRPGPSEGAGGFCYKKDDETSYGESIVSRSFLRVVCALNTQQGGYVRIQSLISIIIKSFVV